MLFIGKELNEPFEMKMNNNENIVSIVDLGNLIRDNTPEGIRIRGCFEGCLMQKIGLVRTVWFQL